MPCYFIRDGHVVGASRLPSGLSDQEAIARAQTQSARRRGRIDGFEVWDSGRLVVKHSFLGAAFVQ